MISKYSIGHILGYKVRDKVVELHSFVFRCIINTLKSLIVEWGRNCPGVSKNISKGAMTRGIKRAKMNAWIVQVML